MYILHNIRILIFIVILDRVVSAHHRIVIKERIPIKGKKLKSTYHRQIKNSNNYHYEDIISSVTTEPYYRINNNNYQDNNSYINKAKKIKIQTTPKRTHFADLIEITTEYSNKFDGSLYKNSINQHNPRQNTSLDLDASNSYNQVFSVLPNQLVPPREDKTHFHKYPQLYKVHEEIIDDNLPPIVSYFNSTNANGANIYYNHKYT